MYFLLKNHPMVHIKQMPILTFQNRKLVISSGVETVISSRVEIVSINPRYLNIAKYKHPQDNNQVKPISKISPIIQIRIPKKPET